jgi:hypothetical protein
VVILFGVVRSGSVSENPVSRDLAAMAERSLESLPKKFNKDITDECGYKSDHKIGRRKNIPDGPNQTLALSHT